MDEYVVQLEEYGITYTEKYLLNKAYWAEKSSAHIGVVNDDVSTGNNILPKAFAYTNPTFYTGYAHNCWWILTCFEWNDNGVQIGENENGIRTKGLISDHDWSEGYYKVTGNNIYVQFNFVAKLKDSSQIYQTVVDSDSAIFFNKKKNHVAGIGETYDNPQDAWHYWIQFAVTNIT